MRYSADHKELTRQAILQAAGRVFRAEGYGGSGIEALTKAAGVTNGAFYGHFKSKAEAFRAIIGLGLGGLAETVAGFQAAHGDDWLLPFVDLYLGPKITCDIGDACTLPMLSSEVARSDDMAHQTYEAAFRRLVAVMAAGLGGDEGRAIGILALLSSGATFARAIADPALRTQIVQATRSSVAALAGAVTAGRPGEVGETPRR